MLVNIAYDINNCLYFSYFVFSFVSVLVKYYYYRNFLTFVYFQNNFTWAFVRLLGKETLFVVFDLILFNNAYLFSLSLSLSSFYEMIKHNNSKRAMLLNITYYIILVSFLFLTITMKITNKKLKQKYINSSIFMTF